MKVIKLDEHGYEYALLGTSLSRNQPPEKMPTVCENLANKEGGHNKFLEFISVWLDITAPRFFWQQMSTYRIGNSWLSESTMYTVMSRDLTSADFDFHIFPCTLAALNEKIRFYKTLTSGSTEAKELKNKAFVSVKYNLPEGFLQRRIMVSNYKALRNIFQQRKNHKLAEWHTFCDQLVGQLEHPDFVEKGRYVTST